MRCLNYLLLPDDEVELEAFLVGDLRLEPVGAVARPDRELPGQGAKEPDYFVYWASQIGPLQRLGDAPPPADAKDAVLRQLNRDERPGDWQDLVGLLHGWLTSHVWSAAPRKDVSRAEEVPA